MSNNTIGAKIVLDGEAEYRKALKNINTEQKELRSEMKLAASEFAGQEKSLEALKKKHEILEKQYDTQQKKVDIYSKAVIEASKKQEEAGSKVDVLREALDKANSKMSDMSEAAGDSTEAIEEQQKIIDELKSKLALAEDGYSKAQIATNNWKTSLNNAQTELNNLAKNLDDSKGNIAEAERAMDDCADTIDEYEKNVEEAGKKSEDFGKRSSNSMQNLAGAMAAAGIVEKVEDITEALDDCNEEFKAFETSTAKISTIADTTKKSMEVINEEILEMASDLNVAAAEIGDATYNALSAGVNTSNSVQFAGEATKLAVGGFTDATTAVDILTTTLNAYRLEADQTTKISDYLVTTQNLGKTTVAELATNMGKVIPVASAYNVEMDNLSTAYAVMTANGIATAETTTYLKAMLNELGDSGSTVSKTLVEMSGKSFATLTKEGKSLGDVIAILGDAVDNNAGAFNELWSSSEAGIGALSIMGSGAEHFNGILDQMQESAGATEEAFETMSNTSERTDERMEVALQNLKIAIGSELTPAINDMKEKGADAFEWATDFVEEHPEVVKAVGALMAGISIFAGVVATATGIMAAFSAAMSIVGPVGLAVGAVAGLVGVIAALSGKTDEATQKHNDLIKAAEETVKALDESTKKRKESQTAEQAELKVVSDLKDELIALNAQESLSDEEKTKLKGIVDELNIAMPELNLAIDEQTGHLSMTNDEAERYIDNMQKTLELGFMEEDLTEIARDHYEAKKSLAEVEEEYNENLRRAEEIQVGWTEACEKGQKAMDEFNTELGEHATDAIGKYYERITELEPELQELREAEQDLQTEYDNMSAKISDSKNVMEEAEQKTDDLKEATVEYKDKTYEVSGSVAESVQGIKTAYDEALTKAKESLQGQVSLFEELSTASELSTQEMSERLRGQAETFTTYSNDLKIAAELAEEGLLDNGLLGAIKDLGIDGAGYLHELVTAAQEDTEAFNELMTEWAVMEETRTELEETLASMTTNYSDQMETLLGIQKENDELMTSESLATSEEINKNVEEALSEMATITEDGIKQMTKTVKDNTPSVKNASSELCTATLDGAKQVLGINEEGTAMSFVSIGFSIPQGIAQGITEGQELVKGALQNVIDNAVESIDLSGITAKINRELGDLF